MNARNFFREYVLQIQQVMEPSAAVQVAETLLEHFAGISRRQMILNPDMELTAAMVQQLESVLPRLKQHEPVQYITGIAWFYDMQFKVSAAVLIPRPETEELVKKVIDQCSNLPAPCLLDVGTGSGCIAITMKKHLPQALVTAVDVSKDALHIAMHNAQQLGAEVHFKQLNFLNEEERNSLSTYDCIVSNPPYIPETEREMMDENVVRYEPELALFAADHLVFYKALAHFGKTHLSPGGYLFCEIHQQFFDDVLKLFESEGYQAVAHKDISGNFRMVEATLYHSR